MRGQAIFSGCLVAAVFFIYQQEYFDEKYVKIPPLLVLLAQIGFTIWGTIVYVSDTACPPTLQRMALADIVLVFALAFIIGCVGMCFALSFIFDKWDHYWMSRASNATQQHGADLEAGSSHAVPLQNAGKDLAAASTPAPASSSTINQPAASSSNAPVYDANSEPISISPQAISIETAA